MLELWTHDLESLEAISQDDETRRLFLRMAEPFAGRPPGAPDPRARGRRDLDDDTKGTLAELASDPAFLAAVEDYLVRTHYFH